MKEKVHFIQKAAKQNIFLTESYPIRQIIVVAQSHFL